MKFKNILPTLVLLTATQAIASDYEIDSTHSSVGFKIKHLSISSVTGRFLDFKGNFSFDPKNISTSKTDATITVASISTDNQKRDDHLKGSDFFNYGAFPSVSFKSTEVKNATEEGFDLLGDLTIHGVTKPVTLKVTNGGTIKDPWGNERAAFTAVTKINRKDFGLTWNKALETGGLLVGEDVTIQIEIEGIKKS
jgi:polyisoprenoid-binding protein YceI